jgi:hypothetical protein
MADQRPPRPAPENGFLADHVRMVLDSLERLTGRRPTDPADPPEAQAQAVFHAPYVLVSHGAEADPRLNYGNLAALALWEADWETFTAVPSRLTADSQTQAERTHLLHQARERGVIDNYSGVRVAFSGRQFMIENATLWTVSDADGTYRGQAALFDRYRYLTPAPGAHHHVMDRDRPPE